MAKRISKLATASDFNNEETKTSDTLDNDNFMTSPTDSEEIPFSDNTTVIVTSPDKIKKNLKALDDCFNGVEKTFLKIGFGLYWFYDTCAYANINGVEYANVADFAKSRYGISKQTTYNYINVIERFAEKVDGEAVKLSDNFKDYKFTQLLTMLDMNDETLAKCNSKMKVKDLKALLNVQNSIGCDDEEQQEEEVKKEEEKKSFKAEKKENNVQLFNIESVEEFHEKQSEILQAIEKTLLQDNGIKYEISILMTW